MMNEDPIVAEARKARGELLESYKGDYKAMLRDMMRRQQETGRKLVKAPAQFPTPHAAHDVYPNRAVQNSDHVAPPHNPG